MSPISPPWMRFIDLEVAELVATLRAGDDRQALFLGLLGGLQHLADAGGVGADRLLGEDVFAGGDGGLEVVRPEARRRGQDDVVDFGEVEQLLVGVQPREAVFLRHVRLVAEFLDRVVRGQVVGQVAAPFRASSKASARATMETLGADWRTLSAAPLPRPPQPIRPTRMASVPPA